MDIDPRETQVTNYPLDDSNRGLRVERGLVTTTAPLVNIGLAIPGGGLITPSAASCRPPRRWSTGLHPS